MPERRSSVGSARRARNAHGTVLTGVVLLLSVLAAGSARGEEETFECVVVPHSVLDLSSGVSGRLDSVHVDRAARVSAGQVLAELESHVERATLRLASARAAMRSELNLREARLEYDERRQNRMANLSLNRVASAQDVDDAERDAVLAGWQVRVAKDNLELAALEAERASASLELREVLSPFEGVVVERFKSPGEYVDEEPILRVARLDPLRVEVIIPIQHHARFRPGLDARVFPETSPDEPWVAEVTAVDAVGDPASGTFRARLELPNPEGKLLAGIKCMASLESGDPLQSPDGVVLDESVVPLWYSPQDMNNESDLLPGQQENPNSDPVVANVTDVQGSDDASDSTRDGAIAAEEPFEQSTETSDDAPGTPGTDPIVGDATVVDGILDSTDPMDENAMAIEEAFETSDETTDDVVGPRVTDPASASVPAPGSDIDLPG